MGKKKRNDWKEYLPDREWTDGKDRVIMSTGKYFNEEGISLKRGGINRSGNKYPKKGSFWIPSKMNVENWIDWLYFNIKEIFNKIWSRKIESNLESIKKRLDELDKIKNERENEIDKIKKNIEKLKEAEESIKKNQELAEKVKKEEVKSWEALLKSFREDYIEYSYTKNIRYEDKIKEFLQENRWVLGLDCEFCKKNVNLDQQSQIDMHIVNNFGQNKIFEFKSPNIPVFVRKGGDLYKRLKASKEFLEALDELISYIKRTSLNALIVQEGGLKILDPSGIIVIGYKIDEQEKILLESWNSFLYPHIKIIPYESLLKKTENEIELIKEYLKINS